MVIDLMACSCALQMLDQDQEMKVRQINRFRYPIYTPQCVRACVCAYCSLNQSALVYTFPQLMLINTHSLPIRLSAVICSSLQATHWKWDSITPTHILFREKELLHFSPPKCDAWLTAEYLQLQLYISITRNVSLFLNWISLPALLFFSVDQACHVL